jgi:2-polyprenyl-6-methoxyphenol hydroxylase-like FAD-dependent oxidoreductase
MRTPGVARCQTLNGPWEWLLKQEEAHAWPGLTAARTALADQSSVEPILAQAARDRGAELRLGTELTAFEDNEHGVTAQLTDLADGNRYTVHADYLIAADGSQSMA